MIISNDYNSYFYNRDKFFRWCNKGYKERTYKPESERYHAGKLKL